MNSRQVCSPRVGVKYVSGTAQMQKRELKLVRTHRSQNCNRQIDTLHMEKNKKMDNVRRRQMLGNAKSGGVKVGNGIKKKKDQVGYKKDEESEK